MANLYAKLSDVAVPDENSKIYKEECAVSYQTANSEGGLFLDLQSFVAFGRDFVSWNFEKTGHSVYLRIKKTLKEDSNDTQEERPKILAIGVQGGFEAKKEEYSESYALVLLPGFEEFDFSDVNLPLKVTAIVNSILACPSAERQEKLSAWIPDKKAVSKHAETLKQLENGVKVPSSNWQCSKCDKNENLWLNLSDGTILCGRRNWDGSGGNNHAVEHYQATGFPLAVKLGTITPDLDTADVYSYAEDDQVIDPLLPQHLSHFGIDFSSMKKTELTTAERELDQNLSFDWNRIQEAGKELSPVFGPGYTGMLNLGNSCYMASVMQVIFSVPYFQDKFFRGSPLRDAFLRTQGDISADFTFQTIKLAHGLLSGSYSFPPVPEKPESMPGISPSSFKAMIGKGHPEFSTGRQQDALEFFHHFLERLSTEGPSGDSPGDPFTFLMQDRLQCGSSGQVRYTERSDNVVSLGIPVSRAINAGEVQSYKRMRMEKEREGEALDSETVVRPVVPLSACLEAFMAEETIEGFYSDAIQARTTAHRRAGLLSLPDVLVLHMRRYVLEQGSWVPKKLDVLLDVPDELDASLLKVPKGPLPHETVMVDPAGGSGSQGGPQVPAKPAADPAIVSQLVDMGFPQSKCEQAAVKTANSSLEEAMNWLLSNMDSSDEPDSSAVAPVPVSLSESKVEILLGFGFSRTAAVNGLRLEGDDLERAAEWIMTHPAEAENAALFPEDPSPAEGNAGVTRVTDGAPGYSLFAFVSHMGANTQCGHYVCHVKKDGRWVLFNDAKVALSDDVPKEMGYLYFYRRNAA